MSSPTDQASGGREGLPGAPASMRVLVTGGAGFIGSHVVDRLLAAGHRPVIYDVRRSPYHAPAKVPSVRGDLLDLERLCEAADGCDAIIHLAAAADVNEVRDAPADAEQRNARGTLHVLEAARAHGVKRVLYASTIWVYSDTAGPLMEESVPLCPPGHLYTATKLAGELYCHAYRELYGVCSTILRFGIPYGPRARAAAVVPSFVTRALAGEPLTIAGDGRQSRRFVYVEDLADGVVRALAPVAANRVYNLVGAEEVTIAEIAETVRRLVGDVEIRHVPGRAGDFAGATISGERAEAELGWRPTTPFREGVRRYVEWHRDGAQAPAAQRAPARARAAGALLRRGLVALVSAALAAVMIIGLASLMPVDGDMDVYDTFASTLVLLLPLVLAAGFEWREAHRRWFRAALWAVVGACVLALALPWPPVLDHLGHAHPVVLSLGALSAALAARLCGARARLGSWLAATDS